MITTSCTGTRLECSPHVAFCCNAHGEESGQGNRTAALQREAKDRVAASVGQVTDRQWRQESGTRPVGFASTATFATFELLHDPRNAALVLGYRPPIEATPPTAMLLGLHPSLRFKNANTQLV